MTVQRKVGRPSFVATAQMKDHVEQMVHARMSISDIASAIGCTPPTLRLHFRDQLELGKARKRAKIIKELWLIATGGGRNNISALKYLDAMSNGDAEAAVKTGKKEQQAEEALDAGAGTAWGQDLGAPPSANTSRMN